MNDWMWDWDSDWKCPLLEYRPGGREAVPFLHAKVEAMDLHLQRICSMQDGPAKDSACRRFSAFDRLTEAEAVAAGARGIVRCPTATVHPGEAPPDEENLAARLSRRLEEAGERGGLLYVGLSFCRDLGRLERAYRGAVGLMKDYEQGRRPDYSGHLWHGAANDAHAALMRIDELGLFREAGFEDMEQYVERRLSGLFEEPEAADQVVQAP